eukprot:6175756-Pleurochrysis_carterae.AAC.4
MRECGRACASASSDAMMRVRMFVYACVCASSRSCACVRVRACLCQPASLVGQVEEHDRLVTPGWLAKALSLAQHDRARVLAQLRVVNLDAHGKARRLSSFGRRECRDGGSFEQVGCAVVGGGGGGGGGERVRLGLYLLPRGAQPLVQPCAAHAQRVCRAEHGAHGMERTLGDEAVRVRARTLTHNLERRRSQKPERLSLEPANVLLQHGHAHKGTVRKHAFKQLGWPSALEQRGRRFRRARDACDGGVRGGNGGAAAVGRAVVRDACVAQALQQVLHFGLLGEWDNMLKV